MYKLVLALALGAAATVDVTADVKAWHAANGGSDPKAAGPKPRRRLTFCSPRKLTPGFC